MTENTHECVMTKEITHTVTHERSTDECESYLQAVCTCGWKGRKQSNMNNWQMHDLAASERAHLFNVVVKSGGFKP